MTTGDVGSEVVECDLQTIWNPRKNCGSFVDVHCRNQEHSQEFAMGGQKRRSGGWKRGPGAEPRSGGKAPRSQRQMLISSYNGAGGHAPMSPLAMPLVRILTNKANISI